MNRKLLFVITLFCLFVFFVNSSLLSTAWDNTSTKQTPLSDDYPEVFINFAGNPNDRGGPYWAYITSDGWSGEQGQPAAEGYYTCNSCQMESWMYINLTVIDEDALVSVDILWMNLTTGTQQLYPCVETGNNHYEFHSLYEGIEVSERHVYSFDIIATDVENHTTVQSWEKIGVGDDVDHQSRRMVYLDCDTENIAYQPLYFHTTQYFADDAQKLDHLFHDQGADGSLYDTGILKNQLPSDLVHERHCSVFVGWWFDETICTNTFALSTVYFHFWWHTDNDHLPYIGWQKSRGYLNHELPYPYINQYATDAEEAQSSIVYNGKEYFLSAHTLSCYPFLFRDNDIYEFNIGFLGSNPSGISNRSFPSFILLNVPSDAALNASYGDSDGDFLSDWFELYRSFTNPFLSDTDNDGASDFEEWTAADHGFEGSDPNDYTNRTEYRVILGDLNQDLMVNLQDINAFVLALSNPVLYKDQYAIEPTLTGDINQDGKVNIYDINPFILHIN